MSDDSDRGNRGGGDSEGGNSGYGGGRRSYGRDDRSGGDRGGNDRGGSDRGGDRKYGERSEGDRPRREPPEKTRTEHFPTRRAATELEQARTAQPVQPSDLTDPHGSRHEAALRFTLKVLPQIQKAFLAGNFDIESKPDKSPVTDVDRDVERRLRELITTAFPDDGIHGEEHDDTPGTSGYRWILDPIDGTRPFVHGVPLFGTLVAVEHAAEGERPQPVVGVCATGVGDGCRVHEASLQFGDWVGSVYRGNGKRLDTKLQTRPCKSLKEATICYTQLDLFDDDFTRSLLNKLLKRCNLVRGWGDCLGHMLVATGRVDAMIDPQLSLWDAAALQPIAKAAGATFMDFEGDERHDGGSGITCSPEITSELMELIFQCRAETL